MNDKFILIGHPVAHSVSPAIHSAAYEVLGRVAQYELRDAPTEQDVSAAVEELREGKLRGANVTVPWKKLALQLADRVDASAAAVGAANVLMRDEAGAVVAYNTDALALAEELRELRTRLATSLHNEPLRNDALVLGTGGAALAAVVSCQRAGFSHVFVSGRKFDPSLPTSAWPEQELWRERGARVLPWPDSQTDWSQLGKWGAIVQATSAGMHGSTGGEELAQRIPWARLPPLIAYDLVYNPPETPFLRAAKQAGHLTSGGLGMLVGQAAQAIRIWWQKAPPLAPLSQAARQALGLPSESSHV